MQYLKVLSLLLLISSCSFKGSEKDDSKATIPVDGGTRGQLSAKPIDITLDSDGDQITNVNEVSMGLNPYIANVPKINISFLQDYSIAVNYQGDETFVIDTKVARNDSSFKFRVGNLFLKENSYNNAARIGRFNGVSWGTIKQEDFSWFSYPAISSEFYHNKVNAFETINKPVESISINLENSLKLEANSLYHEISNLEVDFYYYDFEKEDHIKIHSQTIDKVFQQDVRTVFSVYIENVPHQLLAETYFRRGRFIVSEVRDYYIPKLKMKYSELMRAVRAKTVPLYLTTPFKSDLSYIAVGKDGESFIEILKKRFASKFTIQSNELIQVEQFKNNLPSFTNLSELRSEDKKGRWFVMTNELKDHYLKHAYKVGDSITLSFITGKELSQQTDEKIFSKKTDLYSDSSSYGVTLGNISQNSNVEFILRPKLNKGVKLNSEIGYFNFSPAGACNGNCSGGDWWVNAQYSVNSFSHYENKLSFTSTDELNSVVKLRINNTVLDLPDLIKKNIAFVEFKSDESGQYISYSLTHLTDLGIIEPDNENFIQLIVYPKRVAHEGEGVKLQTINGHNIDKVFHAGLITMQEAGKRKIPMSITSWEFDNWKDKVPWGQRMNDGYVPIVGERKLYFDGIVVDVTSTVTNFYN